MKKSLATLGILIGVVLLEGCYQTNTQEYEETLKQAQVGLEPAVAQVNQFPDLKVLAVKYYRHYDWITSPPSCYYARAYLLLGTTIQSPDSVQVFAEHLQSLGWTFRDFGQYEDAKLLLRGTNEVAAVEAYGPGPELEDAADYDELRKTYSSLVFLRFDYILPDERGC